MSIHAHECVSIRCDICGDGLFNDEDIVEHFDLAREARNDAKRRDWYIADGLDVCDGCVGEPHEFIPGRTAHIERLGVIHDEPRCKRCDTPESYPHHQGATS